MDAGEFWNLRARLQWYWDAQGAVWYHKDSAWLCLAICCQNRIRNVDASDLQISTLLWMGLHFSVEPSLSKNEGRRNWSTKHGKDQCWPRLSLFVYTELALKMRTRVSGNCLGTYVCIHIGFLGYELDYRGILVREPTGAEVFLLSRRLPNRLWGSSSLMSRGTGHLPVGFKRPGSQVDRVLSSSADVKSMWSRTSTIHDVLMEWYIFITTAEFVVPLAVQKAFGNCEYPRSTISGLCIAE